MGEALLLFFYNALYDAMFRETSTMDGIIQCFLEEMMKSGFGG